MTAFEQEITHQHISIVCDVCTIGSQIGNGRQKSMLNIENEPRSTYNPPSFVIVRVITIRLDQQRQHK